MENIIIDEVVQRLSIMPINLQRQVLDFVEALRATAIQGIPGKNLTRFAGMISIDDLNTMRMAIESDCEQVDPDAW